MAEDPNLIMRMDVVGDHIETWMRREMEWTDRHTNALLDVVLSNRFKNALFQRIVEDSKLRNEMHNRINNRESSAG